MEAVEREETIIRIYNMKEAQLFSIKERENNSSYNCKRSTIVVFNL